MRHKVSNLSGFSHLFRPHQRPLMVPNFHNGINDSKGQDNQIYTKVKGRGRYVPVTSYSEIKHVLKMIIMEAKNAPKN